jgi:hypothetical protein
MITFAVVAIAVFATAANGASKHRWLDSSFAQDGSLTIPGTSGKTVYDTVCETDHRDSLYMLVSYDPSGRQTGTFLAKADRRGRIDRRFGLRGVVSRLPTMNPEHLAVDARRRVTLVEHRDTKKRNTIRLLVSRLRADGRTDFGFGHRGLIDFGTFPEQSWPDVFALESGRVAFVVNSSPPSEKGQITLYNENGKVDVGFGDKGMLQLDGRVVHVTEMHDGRVVVSQQIARDPADSRSPEVLRILMLTRDGAPDIAWAAAGVFDSGDLQERASRAYFSDYPSDYQPFSSSSAIAKPIGGGSLLIAATSSLDTGYDPKNLGWAFRLTSSGKLSTRYGRVGLGSLGDLSGDNEGDYISEQYPLYPLANGHILVEDQYTEDEYLFEGAKTLLADGRKFRYGPKSKAFPKTEFLNSVATADGKRIYVCGPGRPWRAWALKTSR